MGLFSISKLVLRSLFQRPATIKYPLRPHPAYHERARGHIEIDINECIFCSLCKKKCPTHAIEVDKENQSWEINRMHCIQCNSCVEACPKHCLAMRNEPAAPAAEERIDRYARIPGDQTDL